MSTEDNKALVRRFYEEVWGKGDVAVTREVFASDYLRHDLRPTTALPGPEGQARIAADFRAAFPDLEIQIDLLMAESDLVAARWTMQGTHLGSWAGQQPTGKKARFSGVNIFRIAQGRVVEIWNHRDDLGLIQQIGLPIYAGAAPEAKRSGA
jgi:steroid delta-isomerase-like uncharacterized protein